MNRKLKYLNFICLCFFAPNFLVAQDVKDKSTSSVQRQYETLLQNHIDGYIKDKSVKKIEGKTVIKNLEDQGELMPYLRRLDLFLDKSSWEAGQKELYLRECIVEPAIAEYSNTKNKSKYSNKNSNKNPVVNSFNSNDFFLHHRLELMRNNALIPSYFKETYYSQNIKPIKQLREVKDTVQLDWYQQTGLDQGLRGIGLTNKELEQINRNNLATPFTKKMMKRFQFSQDHIRWEVGHCEVYKERNIYDPIAIEAKKKIKLKSFPVDKLYVDIWENNQDEILTIVKELSHDDIVIATRYEAYKDPSLWEPGEQNRYMSSDILPFIHREQLSQEFTKIIQRQKVK
ncbi:hypothetical protein [uncultured Gimesia sp.]|uniref:hypothetical protein n=1 Tax=uncultured Gimesia sp. TaxID=1678688 RepID=UPI0030DCCD4A|tara:strand:+ start:58203 stop:59231 length:1029 start_codon:yes stop_codon:yes gene_type:complete